MTIAEFKENVKGFLKEEALNDNSIFEKIESDIESVVNTSLQGTLRNKDEILAEKKKLQQEYKTLKDSVGPLIDAGITLDQFNQLKSQLEELQTKGTGNPEDIKALQERFYREGKTAKEQELAPRLKEFETTVSTLQKQKEETFDKYINTLKHNQIMEAVKKLHIQADKYWLKGFSADTEVDYNESEDRITLMVPNPADNSGSKVPLEDWVRLFPNTPEGKKLIIPPMNTGSGSVGSDGKPIQHKSLQDTIGAMFT